MGKATIMRLTATTALFAAILLPADVTCQTSSPTMATPTNSPSSSPLSTNPTDVPTTSNPSQAPSTSPSSSVPTLQPSMSPTEAAPTSAPSTSEPTIPFPTASPTTSTPSATPTTQPSDTPTTLEPTQAPTPMPTSQCAPEILVEVDLREAAANVACNVSDLELLVPGDRYTNTEYGSSFTGSETICEPACIDAVALLVNSWGRQECDAGGTDYGHRRSLHRETQASQYQCNPPNQACTNFLADFEGWKLTPHGQACVRHYRETIHNASSGMNAEQGYIDFCQGGCMDEIDSKLNLMFDAGCNGWPAYITQREEFDVFCSSTGDGTEGSLEYCHEAYVAGTADIEMALDATSSVAQREAALSRICSSCFSEIQTIRSRTLTKLRRVLPETELCIQDVANGIPKFCLPEFESNEQSLGSNTSLTDISEAMCSDSMGRCASRMWAHRLAQWHTTESDSSKYTALLRYSCAEIESGSTWTRCSALADIQALEAGNFTQATSSSVECTPDAVNGQCQLPESCSLWPVDDQARNTCPTICQNGMKAVIDSTGCCYASWRLFLTEYNGVPPATFERTDHLASICCEDSSSTCASGFAETCNLGATTRRLSITLFDVPYLWVQANRGLFSESITSDLARILGILASDIELAVVEDNFFEDGSQTSVEFLIRTSSPLLGDKIVNTFNIITGNTFAAQSFTSAQSTYRTRTLYYFANTGSRMTNPIFSLVLGLAILSIVFQL